MKIEVPESAMVYEDETVEHWLNAPKEDLAARVAVMHRWRRHEWFAEALDNSVMAARAAVASCFISGEGVEVGAGSRPFPLPQGAQCFYGDIRDGGQLSTYFNGEDTPEGQRLDAQTFHGVKDQAFDFVISAHVIEHLQDPGTALLHALRVLRPNGVLILVAPDMLCSFDRTRPPTSLDHVLPDMADGGEGTRRQAYEEHIRYVHPLEQPPVPEAAIEATINQLIAAAMDIHWHAWTVAGFGEMVSHVVQGRGAVVNTFSSVNEIISVIRK